MNPQSYDYSHMYIGNSLSQCILSILRGDMPLENVRRIEAGTAIPNYEALKSMIFEQDYFGTKYDKHLILELCEYLLFRGKIVQCRLNGTWKVCKETWTIDHDWEDAEHQEPSEGAEDHALKYQDRMKKKLMLSWEIVEKQAEMDSITVVDR